MYIKAFLHFFPINHPNQLEGVSIVKSHNIQGLFYLFVIRQKIRLTRNVNMCKESLLELSTLRI